MHSRQVSDGYIHAVVQSGLEGDGYMYVDPGLTVFPSVARSTKEFNPSYSSNVGKEEPLLTTEVGMYNIAIHLTTPGRESDVESTISDDDDYVQCDVLNIQPVQSSTLHPTCYSNLLEVNGCDLPTSPLRLPMECQGICAQQTMATFTPDNTALV